MRFVNNYIGKLGLLSIILTGVMAMGSVNAFAGTLPVKAKARAVASTKTNAPSKTKKAKKKRHHARRSTVKSVKKS